MFRSVASPFLQIGQRVPLVHSSGTGEPSHIPHRSSWRKEMGRASDLAWSAMENCDDKVFRASICMLFGPAALWFCILFNMFCISTKVGISSSSVSVGRVLMCKQQ